jgi:aminomethyltransferase
MKKTPLHDCHVSLGAKMVEFAGYEMPIWYKGIIEEHGWVRKSCGAFDVSHMAEFIVTGRDSAAFIDRLATSAISGMHDGKVMYGVLCRDDGGCIDDILVYRMKADSYMIVANASNRQPVSEWFSARSASCDVAVEDVSDETAMVAIQGPSSAGVLRKAGFAGHDAIPYYSFGFPSWKGEKILCSRTGYTGEDGFEVFGSGEEITDLWSRVLKDSDVRPIGLGARDTLRLECCFSLYGHELSLDVTPLEAGLSWAVDMSKDFIGKESMKKKGKGRGVSGFEMIDRAIARPGCDVFGPDGARAGTVTSGSFLPTLNKNMGLCLISAALAVPGQELLIDIRGQKKKAQVVKKPFYMPVQRRRKHP